MHLHECVMSSSDERRLRAGELYKFLASDGKKKHKKRKNRQKRQLGAPCADLSINIPERGSASTSVDMRIRASDDNDSQEQESSNSGLICRKKRRGKRSNGEQNVPTELPQTGRDPIFRSHLAFCALSKVPTNRREHTDCDEDNIIQCLNGCSAGGVYHVAAERVPLYHSPPPDISSLDSHCSSAVAHICRGNVFATKERRRILISSRQEVQEPPNTDHGKYIDGDHKCEKSKAIASPGLFSQSLVYLQLAENSLWVPECNPFTGQRWIYPGEYCDDGSQSKKSKHGAIASDLEVEDDARSKVDRENTPNLKQDANIRPANVSIAPTLSSLERLSYPHSNMNNKSLTSTVVVEKQTESQEPFLCQNLEKYHTNVSTHSTRPQVQPMHEVARWDQTLRHTDTIDECEEMACAQMAESRRSNEEESRSLDKAEIPACTPKYDPFSSGSRHLSLSISKTRSDVKFKELTKLGSVSTVSTTPLRLVSEGSVEGSCLSMCAARGVMHGPALVSESRQSVATSGSNGKECRINPCRTDSAVSAARKLKEKREMEFKENDFMCIPEAQARLHLERGELVAKGKEHYISPSFSSPFTDKANGQVSSLEDFSCDERRQTSHSTKMVKAADVTGFCRNQRGKGLPTAVLDALVSLERREEEEEMKERMKKEEERRTIEEEQSRQEEEIVTFPSAKLSHISTIMPDSASGRNDNDEGHRTSNSVESIYSLQGKKCSQMRNKYDLGEVCRAEYRVQSHLNETGHESSGREADLSTLSPVNLMTTEASKDPSGNASETLQCNRDSHPAISLLSIPETSDSCCAKIPVISRFGGCGDQVSSAAQSSSDSLTENSVQSLILNACSPHSSLEAYGKSPQLKSSRHISMTPIVKECSVAQGNQEHDHIINDRSALQHGNGNNRKSDSDALVFATQALRPSVSYSPPGTGQNIHAAYSLDKPGCRNQEICPEQHKSLKRKEHSLKRRRVVNSTPSPSTHLLCTSLSSPLFTPSTKAELIPKLKEQLKQRNQRLKHNVSGSAPVLPRFSQEQQEVKGLGISMPYAERQDHSQRLHITQGEVQCEGGGDRSGKNIKSKRPPPKSKTGGQVPGTVANDPETVVSAPTIPAIGISPSANASPKFVTSIMRKIKNVWSPLDSGCSSAIEGAEPLLRNATPQKEDSLATPTGSFKTIGRKENKGLESKPLYIMSREEVLRIMRAGDQPSSVENTEEKSCQSEIFSRPHSFLALRTPPSDIDDSFAKDVYLGATKKALFLKNLANKADIGSSPSSLLLSPSLSVASSSTLVISPTPSAQPCIQQPVFSTLHTPHRRTPHRRPASANRTSLHSRETRYSTKDAEDSDMLSTKVSNILEEQVMCEKLASSADDSKDQHVSPRCTADIVDKTKESRKRTRLLKMIENGKRKATQLCRSSVSSACPSLSPTSPGDRDATHASPSWPSPVIAKVLDESRQPPNGSAMKFIVKREEMECVICQLASKEAVEKRDSPEHEDINDAILYCRICKLAVHKKCFPPSLSEVSRFLKENQSTFKERERREAIMWTCFHCHFINSLGLPRHSAVIDAPESPYEKGRKGGFPNSKLNVCNESSQKARGLVEREEHFDEQQTSTSCVLCSVTQRALSVTLLPTEKVQFVHHFCAKSFGFVFDEKSGYVYGVQNFLRTFYLRKRKIACKECGQNDRPTVPCGELECKSCIHPICALRQGLERELEEEGLSEEEGVTATCDEVYHDEPCNDFAQQRIENHTSNNDDNLKTLLDIDKQDSVRPNRAVERFFCRYHSEQILEERAQLLCCGFCGNDENAEEMIECDECEQGYHFACLQPKLTSLPEGEWFCSKCVDSGLTSGLIVPIEVQLHKSELDKTEDKGATNSTQRKSQKRTELKEDCNNAHVVRYRRFTFGLVNSLPLPPALVLRSKTEENSISDGLDKSNTKLKAHETLKYSYIQSSSDQKLNQILASDVDDIDASCVSSVEENTREDDVSMISKNARDDGSMPYDKNYLAGSAATEYFSAFGQRRRSRRSAGYMPPKLVDPDYNDNWKRGRKGSNDGMRLASDERSTSALHPITPSQVVDALSEIRPNHLAQKAVTLIHYVNTFPVWKCHLLYGHSLLLYGLGSKTDLLNHFTSEFLFDGHVVTINAYRQFSMRMLLAKISKELLGIPQRCSTLLELGLDICQTFSGPPRHPGDRLYIIVHGIDAEALRSSVESQRILSILATADRVHVVASSDHANASLLWDDRLRRRFNWLWKETNTFAPYTKEIIFQLPSADSRQHFNSEGIRYILKSLTPRHREILQIVVDYFVKSTDQKGMEFQALLKRCREDMIVANDRVLRNHLVELKDHKLVVLRRNPDGKEYLQLNVPRHIAEAELMSNRF